MKYIIIIVTTIFCPLL